MPLFANPQKMLVKAVQSGDFDGVKLLYEKYCKNGKISINASTKKYQPVIFYAIGARNYAMIKLLLRHGADINIKGEFDTPLRTACSRGDFEMVKFLIDNKAKINDNGDGSSEAVFLASYNGHEEIYDYLVSKGGIDNRQLKTIKIRHGNCAICSKNIGQSILSIEFTDKYIYKCSSCGLLYCIDCRNQLRKENRRCVKCGESNNSIICE